MANEAPREEPQRNDCVDNLSRSVRFELFPELFLNYECRNFAENATISVSDPGERVERDDDEPSGRCKGKAGESNCLVESVIVHSASRHSDSGARRSPVPCNTALPLLW